LAFALFAQIYFEQAFSMQKCSNFLFCTLAFYFLSLWIFSSNLGLCLPSAMPKFNRANNHINLGRCVIALVKQIFCNFTANIYLRFIFFSLGYFGLASFLCNPIFRHH